ncbi:MAG TPA: LCP family protein [bacterium]|nr:LCP family protein [bacterium]
MLINKKKPSTLTTRIKSFFRRRPVKIVTATLLVIFVVCVAFVGYLASSGSKVFESGFGGTALLKTLYGQEKISGEDEGRVNVLFVGMGGSDHPGGELTDSMILASIDTKNNKLAMISIPRDLTVPIPGKKGGGKINEAFASGERIKKGSGSSVMMETVEGITGVPINYYMSIDFAGFEKIVNELGGIDVLVDKAINDPYFPDTEMVGYEPFKISAGMHHMDGKIALRYARSRHTSSDFDRSSRQQKILAAIKEKAASAGLLTNPKKILDIATIIGDHFRTNLTPSEMKRLVELTKSIDKNTFITKVLSNGNDGLLVSDTVDGRYVLKAKKSDFSEIKDLARNIFTTPEEDIATSAKVEVLNGTKTAGMASKVAQSLQKNEKLEIINIDSVKEGVKATVIYDHTGGKKKLLLDSIKKQVDVPVLLAEKSTIALDPLADFSVIIGADFSTLK